MLDVLLNNPFLIVIVIMVLSSLFGSGNKNKQQEQKPTKPNGSSQQQTREQQQNTNPNPKRKSIFDDFRQELEEVFPTFEQENKRPVQTNQNTSRKNEQSRSSYEPPVSQERVNTYAEAQKRLEHSSRKSDLEKEYSALKQKLNEKQKQPVLQVKRPKATQTKVVEGIIWSEILGPPRAKKPFRSNGFRD